nr:K(+)-transporting ATPase subunit F [Antrihabitans stalactiti]
MNRAKEQDVCACVHRADGRDIRPARPGRACGGAAVNLDNIVGLALSVLLAVFLVAALLFPERF